MWESFDRWRTNKPALARIQERVAEVWPVDMHNHLLPNVDDGIRTLDETIHCLRQYAEWGVRRVISTPHISQDYYPNTADKLLQLVPQVQQAIAEANLPIDFTVAAEYLLDEQFDHLLRTDQLLSFGKSQYVLIETGWAAPPRQLSDWLFALQVKGYTPVLAHPERYRYYQTEPHLLKNIRAQGCLLQLNLMSLTGRYGSKTKQFAQALLQENCISLVGSDLHRETDLDVLQTVFTSSAWKPLQRQPLIVEQLQ